MLSTSATGLGTINAVYGSFDTLGRLNYRILLNTDWFGAAMGLGQGHRSSCALNDVVKNLFCRGLTPEQIREWVRRWE